MPISHNKDPEYCLLSKEQNTAPYHHPNPPPKKKHTQKILVLCMLWGMGRGSAVSMATCYRLDSPVIESRWGAKSSAPIQTGPGAHPASYTVGTGSFARVKQPGSGIDHPPPSSTKVKERVKLYLYSPSGPSWPVLFYFTLYALGSPSKIGSARALSIPLSLTVHELPTMKL